MTSCYFIEPEHCSPSKIFLREKCLDVSMYIGYQKEKGKLLSGFALLLIHFPVGCSAHARVASPTLPNTPMTKYLSDVEPQQPLELQGSSKRSPAPPQRDAFLVHFDG